MHGAMIAIDTLAATTPANSVASGTEEFSSVPGPPRSAGAANISGSGR